MSAQIVSDTYTRGKQVIIIGMPSGKGTLARRVSMLGFIAAHRFQEAANCCAKRQGGSAFTLGEQFFPFRPGNDCGADGITPDASLEHWE